MGAADFFYLTKKLDGFGFRRFVGLKYITLFWCPTFGFLRLARGRGPRVNDEASPLLLNDGCQEPLVVAATAGVRTAQRLTCPYNGILTRKN